jgi:hypothetical protein
MQHCRIATCLIIFSARIFLLSADAAIVYRNSFDDPGSLDDFTVYGEDFSGYDPPPLHEVSIDDGQLRIDSTDHRPHGPDTYPLLSGRAFLSMDASAVCAPGYAAILSHNNGRISWSFNLSNRDGAYNNRFACVLASTLPDPYSDGGEYASGYAFCGGGMVGSRMYIKRFDYGLDGGGSILIDVTDGLGNLPEKGSFRVTFDPVTSTWSLFGETGSQYTDPTRVNSLLGSAVDSMYTDEETPYIGWLSSSTGTTWIDNVRIDAVPEPASRAFIACSLLTALFARRRFCG